MQQKIDDPRVGKLFRTDRAWAIVSILTLWALYAFVFYHVSSYINSQDELIALAVSGSMVILFNTAAILSMISQCSRDKEHIYTQDLHYLDLMKSTSGR